MKRARIAAGLIVPVLFAASPSTSFAQSQRPTKSQQQTKSEAARLKSAADVLMDQDRYADALALYERAYELSSDPALLYNEGRVYEALGDYPKALEKLDAFDHNAPANVRALVPGLHDLIADIRGRMATLVVRTNAPNARLLLRQKDEGAIGAERRIPTRAGTASIDVAADGYETFHRDIELSAGTTFTIDANLTLKMKDALVVVRSTPSADVLFDGLAQGRSPLQFHAAPGAHELVATAEGYREERVAMTLALGDRRDIELELQKTPGILSTWWFWTGIGVVIAGGIVTGIALTREKPHSSGTFSGGAIAGP